jgi:transcriptional regulator with AAA-type ATPase domain/predicted ATPase
VDALAELIGESPALAALRERARQLVTAASAARRLPSVLILGETGTGKGLLARALHRASARSRGPFVDVNCAAIPETLLESELFGFERGAFTGAGQSKPGLFQTAHQGTILLDEVALLPLALQAKLLSALEDRAVRRLGATRAEPADIWVLGATNEDVGAALQARRLREDLYHRLAVVTLELPPLRGRGRDVLLLAEHFLARTCADYGLPKRTLAPDARAALTAYPWPGNVRELSNVIERAALLAEPPVITAARLALPAEPPRPEGPASRGVPGVTSSRDVMREHLAATLEHTGWNISRAAEILGVSRNTVMARIARFGLRAPGGARRARAQAPLSASPAAARPPAPTRPSWESRRVVLLLVRTAPPAAPDAPARPLPEAVADKIRTFGGRIEGTSPTGLFAVFGLEPMDEPAMRATYTALVLGHAARTPDLGGVSLQLGLHATELLVRVGGEAPALDAAASRPAWDAVDALVRAAPPGAVVATADAASLVRRRFSVSPLGPGSAAYRVEGLWGATAGAGLPRTYFAGRREELALLESRLDAAGQGRGQVVDLVGDAGMGKSRLLLELTRGARVAAVTFLEGRCLPVMSNTPFSPLLAIVRGAAGIAEHDPPEVIGARLALALGAEAGEASRELVRLLVAEPETEAPAPGAATVKAVFAAIRRLLVTASARRPVLVVVEDMHWTDPTSEACLASLIDAVAGARILVVITYRPDYRPPWMGRGHVTRLSLAPLSRDDSLAVVHAVLRSEAGGEDLAGAIVRRADGNPLFLEELSYAALEGGSAEARGRVPATVEEVIAARLARMRPQTRQVLVAAAVIGRDVPVSLLRRVAALPDEAVDEALEQLERADVLHETGGRGGERAFGFKHALVQDVAYGRVAAPERGEWHRRVLEAIEAAAGGRGADDVEWLAHHAVLAEVHARAVGYLLRAGHKAAARGAPREVIGHLTRALDLLATLPEGPERDRQELALQTTLGPALMTVRGYASAEVERAHARALVLSRRVGDRASAIAVLRGQWVFHLTRAEHRTARDLVEQLAALAEQGEEPGHLLESQMAAGLVALFLGEFERAHESFEHGVAVFETLEPEAQAPLADMAVTCLAYQGRALWFLGFADQALARSQEALAVARAGSSPLAVAQALGLLTNVHQVRGDLKATQEWSETTLAYAGERGFAYWEALARILRSWALAEAGERSAGIAEIHWSLQRYQATGARLGLSWFLALLADAYGRDGQAAEGLRVLADARGVVADTAEAYYEAEIHRLEGELRLAQGAGADEVEACYRRALEIARRQGARAWALRAATSLARLWQDGGRPDEARALMAEVHGGFTEGLDTGDLGAARALLEDLGRAR